MEESVESTTIIGNITMTPSRHTPLDLSNWVEALTLFFTNLSILFSILLVVIFRYIVRRPGDLVITLVQCLAVADVLFCIGEDMGMLYYSKYLTVDALCVTQSFFTTFADLVSFCYVLYIIIHGFSEETLNSQWMMGKKAKWIYHIIAWLLPGVITVSAVATGALGDALSRFGSWCWIDEDTLTDKQRLLWMLFTKQIWEILIYILSGTLIVISFWLKKRKERKKRIQRKFRHSYSTNNLSYSESSQLTTNNADNKRKKPKFNVMIWMLFYFYLTRIWGTTRNFVTIIGLVVGSRVPGFTPLDEHFFIHAQSVGDSLQGTINFVMFCFLDDSVWKHFKRSVKKRFCCVTEDNKSEETEPIIDTNLMRAIK